MKTLYLHIGTPKTATTAIQSFCHDNQEALNQKGYCYPDFSYQFPNVRQLRNAHFVLAFKHYKDRENNFEQSEAVWADCFSKIYEYFETYDNVVLSDEAIWNFGYRENNRIWTRLREESEKGGFIIKVIVYLRRQDEFLFSWWNQQVKEGMVPSSVFTWEKVVDVLPYIQLDYYKMLEMIGSYIGKENITVRVFDRKRFLGNTIYADFMHCVGLEYTDEYKVEEEIQNISLTKNNIEIKRILNTLPELDERNNNLFRQFLSNLSEQNPEEKKYDMFSLEEREAFMVQYREGNQKIENEFLNGEQLFSLVGAEEKWIPTNEKMYADTILLFGTISLKLLHENENLRKELKAQKQEIKKIKESLKHPFRAVKNKMFK